MPSKTDGIYCPGKLESPSPAKGSDSDVTGKLWAAAN